MSFLLSGILSVNYYTGMFWKNNLPEAGFIFEKKEKYLKKIISGSGKGGMPSVSAERGDAGEAESQASIPCVSGLSSRISRWYSVPLFFPYPDAFTAR